FSKVSPCRSRPKLGEMPSMGAMGRRTCLALLLTACVTALPGCFGTSNPSYFPNLVPFGEFIQTHAKPIGPSYFANFDPYAVDLVVRPIDQTNPVRTQFVVVATVRDAKGKPLRGRRIEWMLDGVGHIVEVDESGCHSDRGGPITDKYAFSYTDYFEHNFTRGNKNPCDDFTIRPGQSWCVITSPIEGDSHLTVTAIGINDWDKRLTSVTCKWVDANWIFPTNNIVPAGTPYVLTTKVLRHTDKQPLVNYRVRYTILDDEPPAVFMQTRSREMTAISDYSGNASATLQQTTPRPGLTRIAVEVIRPADPTSPSGVGVSLAKAETTIEWTAPAINLNVVGPLTGGVGADLSYATSVSNSGKVESKSMTVTQQIPDGAVYVTSQPPAFLDGKQLVWTLGRLSSGQSHNVRATFKAIRTGPLSICSSVATEEGIRDTKCIKTDIGEPKLRVTMTGPQAGQLNVPFTYQINVINDGPSPLTNVVVDASFDKTLKHSAGATTMRLPLGTLNAGENRPLPALTLTPTAGGQFTTRVSVKADGGIGDQAEQTISVQQAQLGVKLIGPPRKYVGWPADWEIRVTNEGDVPLTGVQVKNLLPPELVAQSWTEGGKPGTGGGEVIWDVGDLKPREQRTLGVKTRCDKLVQGALNQVIATATPGLSVKDQVNVDVFGLPGLQLEVGDKDDPVIVGKNAIYTITVTNTGTQVATAIDLKATLPKELQLIDNGAKGPSPATVAGQVVTFGRVESLGPQQKLEYQIEAKALRAGDVRFSCEMRSASLTSGQPVVEEEATRIVEPLIGGNGG
ncbi:MAG TPA: hypothetical protein VE988_15770, partial [Gemmataceae bacterium]|nr:hypothetical protein [Gemmataceae bacterium]